LNSCFYVDFIPVFSLVAIKLELMKGVMYANLD